MLYENRFILGVISLLSGYEILQLAAIIRSGAASHRRNFRSLAYTDRVLDGTETIPIVKECFSCKSNCYEDFTGKVLVVIGLNNSLKAGDVPHVKLNDATGFMKNAQRFDDLFKYMDDTFEKVS